MVVSRRALISLVVAEVVFFVIANATSQSHSHPGVVSNVAWYAFLIGIFLLIVLAGVAVVRVGLAKSGGY